MLLVVDIGNSNTVLGLYRGTELIHHWRIESRASRPGDEYYVLLKVLLEGAGYVIEQVQGSILASVVPAMVGALEQACSQLFHHQPLIVGAEIHWGMRNLCDNPKEVGVDRMVNAVAAYERIHQGVIVVDMGTATTFDLVSTEGDFLGGAISPGIGIAMDALFQRTAKLPRVDLIKPQRAIGRNSVESMQAGLIFGFVGIVDGIVSRIRDEAGFPVAVIATGGFAPLVSSESSTVERVEPTLTLEGLRLLYERNR